MCGATCHILGKDVNKNLRDVSTFFFSFFFFFFFFSVYVAEHSYEAELSECKRCVARQLYDVCKGCLSRRLAAHRFNWQFRSKFEQLKVMKQHEFPEFEDPSSFHR